VVGSPLLRASPSGFAVRLGAQCAGDLPTVAAICSMLYFGSSSENVEAFEQKRLVLFLFSSAH
jgi:hypothetical protein